MHQHAGARAAHVVQVGRHPAASGLHYVRHRQKLPQKVLRSGHDAHNAKQCVLQDLLTAYTQRWLVTHACRCKVGKGLQQIPLRSADWLKFVAVLQNLLQAGSAGVAGDGAQEGASSRPRTAEGFSTEHPIDKYIRKLESMVRHGALLWDGSLSGRLAG